MAQRDRPDYNITTVRSRTEYQRIGGVNLRLREHAKHGLIIVENGLATYVWSEEEAGTIWTCETFVHPDHRREGIGLKLVARLQSIPSVRRVRSITGAGRHDVSGMYLKAGHEIMYQDENYIWWEWNVSNS